jgi:hypothetical protein
MKKIIISLLLLTTTLLSAGIPTNTEYHGPTEQLIKRESWSRIASKLKRMEIDPALIPYFNSIAEQEDWGHIGYHGTNQKFRIYQDIIRFTVEEKLNIPIRRDFHFFRVPGDQDFNLRDRTEFFDFWGAETDNKDDLRAKQLLSLNFSIYSNFDVEGSCSVNFFARDFSKKEIDYAEQLSPFYRELGIPPNALDDLFAIADKWLDKEAGILLQIADTSHLSDRNREAYSLADKICYPSKKGGFVHGTSPISAHYARILTDLYIMSDIDIAPQIRLILSNQLSLNPFSQLSVRRWDLYPPETITNYESEMRQYIRRLPYNKLRVKEYRESLINIW